MKFSFKIQQYQTDAVDAVARVFQGQGFHGKVNYIRDLGTQKTTTPFSPRTKQMSFIRTDEQLTVADVDDGDNDDTGYKNEIVQLSDE